MLKQYYYICTDFEKKHGGTDLLLVPEEPLDIWNSEPLKAKVKQLQLQRTEEVLDGLPPIQYMANVIPLLKHEKSLYDMVHNGVQNFLCWEAVTQPDKDAQYVLGQFILPEMVKNILTAPSSFMYRKHYDSRGQKKADKDWKRFFDFNSRDPPPSNVARGWGLVTLSWEQEIYRLNLLSGRTVQNQKYERSFPAWDALVGLPNSASKFRALGRALFECKARRERALIYASDPYLLRHVLAYLRTTNVECLHLLEPGVLFQTRQFDLRTLPEQGHPCRERESSSLDWNFVFVSLNHGFRVERSFIVCWPGTPVRHGLVAGRILLDRTLT